MKSELLPSLVKTHVVFPEGYKGATHVPDDQLPDHEAGPVRLRQRARDAGRQAGRALPDGTVLLAEVWSARLDADKKPVTGADGHFVPRPVALLHRDGA